MRDLGDRSTISATPVFRCWLFTSSHQAKPQKRRPRLFIVGIAPPGLEPKATFGVNQDSPDPESSGRGRLFQQLVGIRPLSEHRCLRPCRSLPASARRNYGKTTALSAVAAASISTPAGHSAEPSTVRQTCVGLRDRWPRVVHLRQAGDCRNSPGDLRPSTTHCSHPLQAVS